MAETAVNYVARKTILNRKMSRVGTIVVVDAAFFLYGYSPLVVQYCFNCPELFVHKENIYSGTSVYCHLPNMVTFPQSQMISHSKNHRNFECL